MISTCVCQKTKINTLPSKDFLILMRNTTKISICRQIQNLIWKRAWISIRDWRTFVFQMLLPTIFFVSGLGYLDLNYLKNNPSLLLTPKLQLGNGETYTPILTNNFNSSGKFFICFVIQPKSCLN